MATIVYPTRWTDILKVTENRWMEVGQERSSRHFMREAYPAVSQSMT